MRQVRKKTSDPFARTYLLKAKEEGIELSWNKYEAMLPQDGFSQLGLSCYECLQGPCRINPFRSEEVTTICGFTKEDLVFNGLNRQAAKSAVSLQIAGSLLAEIKAKAGAGKLSYDQLENKTAKWSIAGENTDQLLAGLLIKLTEMILEQEKTKLSHQQMEVLLALGSRQISLQAFLNDLLELLTGPSGVVRREFGLGVLKAGAVNICLEGVSPLILNYAQELAEELKDEAVKQGAAEGFNIVLVGDISSYHPFNAVTNKGSAEFAILTGLVDMYGLGTEVFGLGRNAAKHYHTVVADFVAADKDKISELFSQAARAFAERDISKILSVNATEFGDSGFKWDATTIRANLEQKSIGGICILGGGSNLKIPEDEITLEIAGNLANQDVLCLTYGNSAVTLGKYGYLNSERFTGSKAVAGAMGYEKGPIAYSLGGEFQVNKVIDFVNSVAGEKVFAIFPELNSAQDLQVALALANSGVQVLSGIKLPVDGSDTARDTLSRIIEFQEAKNLAERVKEKFISN
ncbi:MAG: anaerobic carbon-monoxide dehydrogenase catalytic subunit [Desulfitobacteriaceae bacterium]